MRIRLSSKAPFYPGGLLADMSGAGNLQKHSPQGAPDYFPTASQNILKLSSSSSSSAFLSSSLLKIPEIKGTGSELYKYVCVFMCNKQMNRSGKKSS